VRRAVPGTGRAAIASRSGNFAVSDIGRPSELIRGLTAVEHDQQLGYSNIANTTEKTSGGDPARLPVYV
jgi:hypothetical protein